MFNSIRYSFTNWNPLKEVKFTGLSNYVKLFGNADFLTSLRVTFIWVVMSVVILPVTGLICAVLVEYASSSRRVSGVMRTVLFMPMMMSFVAIGLLWQMIYDPNLGLLNSLLSKLGLIKFGQAQVNTSAIRIWRSIGRLCPQSGNRRDLA